MRTDYRQTENQDLTWHSFFNIFNGIRHRYLDILIIHSANDLEDAYSIVELLISLCKDHSVAGDCSIYQTKLTLIYNYVKLSLCCIFGICVYTKVINGKINKNN